MVAKNKWELKKVWENEEMLKNGMLWSARCRPLAVSNVKSEVSGWFWARTESRKEGGKKIKLCRRQIDGSNCQYPCLRLITSGYPCMGCFLARHIYVPCSPMSWHSTSIRDDRRRKHRMRRGCTNSGRRCHRPDVNACESLHALVGGSQHRRRRSSRKRSAPRRPMSSSQDCCRMRLVHQQESGRCRKCRYRRHTLWCESQSQGVRGAKPAERQIVDSLTRSTCTRKVKTQAF